MTRHVQHSHDRHDAHQHESHGRASREHESHDHGSTTDEAAMAEVLELDASLAGGYADEAADWAAKLADGPVRSAVDLGAGTGVGTLALARRFPEAMLTAVDLSPLMLGRLRAAAEVAGMGEKLRTVEADLDAGWAGVWGRVEGGDVGKDTARGGAAGAPEVREGGDAGGADLAWASSSLHHVQDPDRVLRRILQTLRPGGLLLVLELDDLPRFLGGAGDGLAELEDRCHRAVEGLGWNAHPDWSDALVSAGFRLEGRRTLEMGVGGAGGARTSELARFARLFLSRIRDTLGASSESPLRSSPGGLSADEDLAALDFSAQDLAALDRLLGHGPGSLESLPGLSVRTRRTVWAARRPA